MQSQENHYRLSGWKEETTNKMLVWTHSTTKQRGNFFYRWNTEWSSAHSWQKCRNASIPEWTQRTQKSSTWKWDSICLFINMSFASLAKYQIVQQKWRFIWISFYWQRQLVIRTWSFQPIHKYNVFAFSCMHLHNFPTVQIVSALLHFSLSHQVVSSYVMSFVRTWR